MGEAAAQFKISHATLRKWNREEKLMCVRTVGNTRLVVKQSLLKCLGIEDSVSGKSDVTVCYCRTSTNKQAQDLSRQVEKVKSFVLEKYGVGEPEVISEIGSGLSDSRPKYLKLIEDVVEKRIGRIVCYSSNRLSRYGNNVFKSLCDLKNVELVFMDKENVEKTYEQEMVEDLMAIVHVYSCRLYSQRARETLRKDVEPDAKARIVELHGEGYHMTEICEVLEVEGFICQKDKRPYSHYLVRKTVYEAAEKERLKPSLGEMKIHRGKELVESFIAESCTVRKDERVFFVPIYLEYQKHAKRVGRKAISRKKFSHMMQELGFEMKVSTAGNRVFKGLYLTNQPGASSYNKRTKTYGQ